MCTPDTVARIFIDRSTLNIKRLVLKLEQRTMQRIIPVPLQERRTVPAYRNS